MSRTYRDLSGMTFGRWTVIAMSGLIGDKRHYLCRCNCGTERTVRAADLLSGNSTSCGCYARELSVKLGKSATKHGKYKDREYRIWIYMRQRCANPKNAEFHNYGGRGISVCDRWMSSFENFFKDMGPCPKGKSIGRINNNDNYSPENCRWETPEEQASNTRKNVRVSFMDMNLTLSQWSRKLGVDRSLLRYRYHAGWPTDKILSPPRACVRRIPGSQNVNDLSTVITQ